MRNVLKELNIEKYSATLIDNGFDSIETLLLLEEPHMAELGLALGHRLKLRRWIQQETGMAPAPAPQAAPAPQQQPEEPQGDVDPLTALTSRIYNVKPSAKPSGVGTSTNNSSFGETQRSMLSWFRSRG